MAVQHSGKGERRGIVVHFAADEIPGAILGRMVVLLFLPRISLSP